MIDKQQHRQLLNHSKKLGNLQYINYLKSHQDTLNLIFSIQKYLQPYPAFYLNSLVVGLKGKPLDTVKAELEKEYEKLLGKTSFYHMMNASIEARNNCINKIKRQLTKSVRFLNLFKRQYYRGTIQDEAHMHWVQVEGYSTIQIDQTIQNSIKMLSNIFIDMYRLRDMTIYIVETIYAWKHHLQQHSDRCHQFSPVYYFYQDKNVYQMVLEDTSFIWKSKLSEYISMEAKQDPFFIRNVIQVQQRSTKTVLQKYFLEILYPKYEITVDKSIKCFEMLLFKYKPKVSHLFEEQEILIQNYLKMQNQNHEFDEENLGQTKYSQSPKSKMLEKSDGQDTNKKKNLLNIRGWVFDHHLKAKSKDRIKNIVQNHKQTIKYIAPFNIVNYNQKSSIALAYLSQVKRNQNIIKSRVESKYSSSKNTPRNKQQQQFMSEGEGYRTQNKNDKKSKKNFESQPEPTFGKQSRMMKSLTKLSPIILQDPKEQVPDTPKNKKKVQQVKIENNREHSMNQIKINSFAFEDNLTDNYQQKIKIEQQETPLNIKQFYEIFRADTTAKPKINIQLQKNKKKEKEKQKIIKFKQFLQKSRMQRAKSLNIFKKPKLNFPTKKKDKSKSKQKRQNLNKSRSLNKSNDSYPQFQKIKNEQNASKQLKPTLSKGQYNQFINIKAKSIPYDMIQPYLKYLYGQQHQTSKHFMRFSFEETLKKLNDPFIHCILLELYAQNHKSIGQVILSESLGGRAGRLKYTVQFMNIHNFELIIASVLRLSEQLLSTTPCQEVIVPLIVDKLDVVSCHFVQLIGAGLSQKVGKFGRLAILQKSYIRNTKQDIRQRLYLITSDSFFKKQYDLGLKMMGNYRSLKFQTKCLVLTSNFRLRSKNLIKTALSKYRKVALGQLFVKLFKNVMTKYHIKQLKGASNSSNQTDQFVSLIKNDLFLRNIIQSFSIALQKQGEEHGSQLIYLTTFTNMSQFLNYIKYKRHDIYFEFEFLEESRFILNHDLHLAQLDREISLQFSITVNEQIYILHNHKKIQLSMLKSSKIKTQAYLIPTINDQMHLFLMNASQFIQTTTDNLDMYSYLSYFFKNLHSQIYLNQVPSIILPNLKHNNIRMNKVRMYDGFLKIFPQRQFYSAAMVRCVNYWERYYPNAVAHRAPQGSIIFDYPFLLGYYDVKTKTLLNCFLYSDNKEASP